MKVPLVCAFACLWSVVRALSADEVKVLYEVGRHFELRLATDTNLVLCVENNFCLWRRIGQGTPLSMRFTRGLVDASQASLEVVGQTNTFLRHFQLRLRTSRLPVRRDLLFQSDATFDVEPGRNDSILLRSSNFPDAHIGRTRQERAYIIPDADPAIVELKIVYH